MPIANIGSVPDVVTATVIASDWGNAIGSASKGRVVQRFNSIAERDASITAPVAGMLCYVLATDLFYGYRTTGGWTALIGGPRDTMHARVTRAAAQTLSVGFNTIAFDTVTQDVLGLYSVAQKAFVIPVAGFYILTAGIQLVAMANGSWAQIVAQRNPAGETMYGTTVPQAATAGPGLSVATSFKGNPGDLISVLAQVSAAVSTNAGLSFANLDYLGTG